MQWIYKFEIEDKTTTIIRKREEKLTALDGSKIEAILIGSSRSKWLEGMFDSRPKKNGFQNRNKLNSSGVLREETKNAVLLI